ncbi:MAG: thymidylate synthase [Alphaproteobacteria bacterium]|nr:thymidylate synthase [Alphaproteobacteria bacterium]
MHIKAKTLDDLLRKCIEKLITNGYQIQPSKGACKELFGVILELSNPRARLSQTESKGVFFSCLGELFWYLSRSDELAFIQYYIPHYHLYSDDKKILNGAYGPRIFNMNGIDQYKTVRELLAKKPDSRQAVIQIFQAKDITIETEDVPCTCLLQFTIRNGLLHMHTSMRSNDVFVGLPHDIFAFTMLQEILANDLSVGLGTYKHSVGSLHLYNDDISPAQTYLSEGWQDIYSMPVMPAKNVWGSISQILEAEEKIRKGESLDITKIKLDNYWMDLLRLLKIFSVSKGKDLRTVVQLKNEMSSPVYEQYIRKREKRMQDRNKQKAFI